MAVKPASRLAWWLSTWLGCGRSPLAPGTVGALAAVPLHFGLELTGRWAHFGAVVALTVLGTWAADRTARDLGDDDPSSVVIDEVAGTLIALFIVGGAGWGALVAAFLLFRLFDIAKPGIIDRAQALRPPGVGIMADDVLAGLFAGALALIGARVF